MVEICNYNCPGQLVIGGQKDAVDLAAQLAKEAGARRCIPAGQRAVSHHLMAPAGQALEQRFAAEPLAPWRSRCCSTAWDGKTPEDSIPALLVRQVQSSVYMEDTLRRLAELGWTTSWRWAPAAP